MNGESLRYSMSAFIEAHRGYLWKEIISSQHENPDHLLFVLKTGGRFWDPGVGGYTSRLQEHPADIIRRPYIVGATRDMDCADWAASWVGALFDYRAPVLGFSRRERHLLTCALEGVTDEQSAGILGISLSAVKKLWISIHCRIRDRMPDLTPDTIEPDLPASGRGKEKRRRFLGYLREHPEELRPFSQKQGRARLSAR